MFPCVTCASPSYHLDEAVKAWKKNAKLFMLVLSNENFKISLKRTFDS